MFNGTVYEPPEVWTWERENGGEWASQNRPIAGATHEKVLPIGKHPFQLYSQGTPNGIKISVMFEELLEAGYAAEYDAWYISINRGDQFGSEFTEINPNSKIPAMVDLTGDKPLNVFESGSILVHLAEKFDAFLPSEGPQRTQVLNWLFWQVGSAPYLGGGFGHFYSYAPEKWQYPIDRFAMEVKRQLDVLDRQLAQSTFIAGDELSIADIAIWPWYGRLALGRQYGAADFLDVQSYEHVQRWAKMLDQRPAFKRGERVNRSGRPEYLIERHAASDFD